MTLCIVWKKGNNIHFASDSRLTFGNRGYRDVGIKIFSVPVNIISSTNSETGEYENFYKHSCGLCFSGYTTVAYVTKESIYEAIQNLQALPCTDISLDGICNFICQFYEYRVKDICSLWGKEGLAEFIFAGYCLKQLKLRAFRIFVDCLNSPLKVKKEELFLNGNNLSVIGSGSNKAIELIDKEPNINPCLLLKKIINNDDIKDVGGNIQYGAFEENNFKIFGIQDFKVRKEGDLRTRFILKGIPVDVDVDVDFDYEIADDEELSEIFTKDFSFPFISYPYAQVFKNELQILLGNWHIAKKENYSFLNILTKTDELFPCIF